MQDLTATLTEREAQVYDLMLLGWSNKEIAHEMTLSISGAKFHVSNILAKLGANSRAGAIAYGAGSRELNHPLIGNGGVYNEEQIRKAGAILVELGLGNRKEINETVINLLGVLGGKIK